MTTEGIVILIILSVIIIGSIALAIFINIRNSNYRRFVLDNSEAIKNIEKLNEKDVFEKYKYRMDLYHRFDNKSNWYKTEPVAFLSREIRNNLEKWFNIRSKIEFNKNLFEEYKLEVKGIKVRIEKEFCEQNKKRYKKVNKIEKELFNSKIQRPNTDIFIVVTLRYVSKQGKVDINKNETYGYVELVRILDSVSTSRVDRRTYERLASAERGILSDSIRYNVLRRDGFKCVLCGMSAKDGAILHIDHIIPISKGGKTEMNNLRTLCEKCNIGKSNKIE